MLVLKNLRKQYSMPTGDPICALGGVDFAIDDREFAIVIGANGAGKSTLFDAIAGRCQPDEGTVERHEFKYRGQQFHQEVSQMLAHLMHQSGVVVEQQRQSLHAEQTPRPPVEGARPDLQSVVAIADALCVLAQLCSLGDPSEQTGVEAGLDQLLPVVAASHRVLDPARHRLVWVVSEQLDGVVLCVWDKDKQTSNLIRLSEIPRYDELTERGSLGDLVSQRIIDQYLTPKYEEEHNEKALEWLRSLP